MEHNITLKRLQKKLRLLGVMFLCVWGVFINGSVVWASNINFNATTTKALVTYEDVVGALSGDETPDGGLVLDMDGPIGATEYCDENGNNCYSITDLGSDDQSLSWDDLTDTLGITDGAGAIITGFQDANANLDDLSDGSLSESAIDDLITRDSEWATLGDVETIWGVTLATDADLAAIVEADPVFMAWDKSSGISILESQISDLKSYLTVEADPLFTAWDMTTGISILSSQISDWATVTTDWDKDSSDDFDGLWASLTGVPAELTDGTIGGKADKVVTATAGNLAGLDAGGNLTDSGFVLNDAGTGTGDLWSADQITTAIASGVVTEVDTLDSVTGRGAITTNAITVGGLTVDTNTLHIDVTNNRVGVGTTFPTAGLMLDVEGNVGAASYCDENGANCKTIVELGGGGGGANTFLELSDSPASFAGHQGKAVVVNAAENGLEFVSGGTPSPLPIVRVSSTSAATFTQAAPLTVPWDSEDIKDMGFTHSNVTNNTRLSVDATGTYQISGQVRVNEPTDQRGQYVVKVLVNGVDIGYPMGSGYIRNSQNSSDYWTLVIQSLPLKLNANDYVEVTVEVESQTTTTFDSALVGNESYLSMVQLQGLSGSQGIQGPQGDPGVDGINGVDGVDGAGLWSEGGSDIYFDTGNVGIGLSNPSARLEVDGKIKSLDSIQTGSIATLLALPSCNSLNYGALYFVTSEQQLYVCTNDGDQWKAVGSGGAGGSTSKQVTLAPEYGGATLTGDGSANLGIMRSDFCENGSSSAMPDINTSICTTAGDIHNYYSWTTSEATAQDYDIWIRWRVPGGFGSWSLTNPITVWGKRTDSTNNAITVYVYDTTGALENPGGTQVAGTAWSETSVETSFGGTYTEGEYMTIRIVMNADTADSVQVGEISLDYLSQ